MLLQTNSYVVPRDKRSEHARILRRFRQALIRLGCDHFEVFEQVGANWNTADTSGRFVQIMRFRDRKHQNFVQAAERNDPTCQALLREFCELINVSYQQQQGLFAVGFYSSFLRMPPQVQGAAPESAAQPEQENQGDQSVPTGMLSMGQAVDESASDSDVMPTEMSAETEIPREQATDEHRSEDKPSSDLSSEDHAMGVDFNAESTDMLSDDLSEPVDVEHDAFSLEPESDSPRPGESAQESANANLEADSDPDGEPHLDDSTDEAENRSTPFNS